MPMSASSPWEFLFQELGRASPVMLVASLDCCLEEKRCLGQATIEGKVICVNKLRRQNCISCAVNSVASVV